MYIKVKYKKTKRKVNSNLILVSAAYKGLKDVRTVGWATKYLPVAICKFL